MCDLLWGCLWGGGGPAYASVSPAVPTHFVPPPIGALASTICIVFARTRVLVNDSVCAGLRVLVCVCVQIRQLSWLQADMHLTRHCRLYSKHPTLTLPLVAPGTPHGLYEVKEAAGMDAGKSMRTARHVCGGGGQACAHVRAGRGYGGDGRAHCVFS